MPKMTKQTRIALTPRNIQILWSLHEARYVTVVAGPLRVLATI